MKQRVVKLANHLKGIGHTDLADRLHKLSFKVGSLKKTAPGIAHDPNVEEANQADDFVLAYNRAGIRKSADEELFEDLESLTIKGEGTLGVDSAEFYTDTEGSELVNYNDRDSGVSVDLAPTVPADEILAAEQDNFEEEEFAETEAEAFADDFLLGAQLESNRIEKAAELLAGIFSNGSIPSVRR